MAIFGSDIPTLKYLALAVIGKAGAGKTSLIRSMVEAGLNVAHLDLDGGARSIRDLVGRKNFRYADCGTLAKFNAAWLAMDELDDSWILMVDTFTALLEIKSRDVGQGKDKLTFDQYAKIGGAGVKILMQVKERAKGHDVILLCQEDCVQDDMSHMYWGPRLTGKMTGKVFSDKFDGVFRLVVEQVGNKPAYKLLTVTTSDSETKLRVTPEEREKIPLTDDASNFGNIFKVLRGVTDE